jgi:F-type H+-transporting ATPase subunit b
METLSFDGGLVFWTLVTFAAMFAVLSRYAFRPLRRLLQEREDAIRRSLKEAQDARDEARRIVSLNEEHLNKAREEARKIMREGQQIVADLKREAQQHAKEEADAIVRQAQEEIDRQVRKSMDDLKGTVANLSVRIAEQVIRDELDEKRHAELVDGFIERLKASR